MLSQVPQIRAAIEEEAETRDAAFLEAAAEVCGVTILPLTLRRFLLLAHSRNPFVCGGAITPEAVAQLLWCCSDQYNPGGIGRDIFCAALSQRNYGELLAWIEDYLSFSFFDSPAASGEPREVASYYSLAAVYVDLFGREYGWGLREVMDAPIAVLFQLTKRIQQRTDSGAILFNPLSDKAKMDYVRGLNASNGNAAVAPGA